MKKYNIAYVITLSVIVVLLILSGNYKKNVASLIDNRFLTEFPEKIDSDLTKQLTDYTQDRIGCRDMMISFYTNFNNIVFHIFPNHVYGKDGNLFCNGKEYIASYQHLDGDEEYAEDFAQYIDKLQDYCNTREIEFMYMLNPDKKTIYPEKMPESIGVYDAENLTEQIKRKIEEKGVRHVFIDDAFINKRGGEPLFYKCYDVSHWSDYGRIMGVNAVLKELSYKPLSVAEDFEKKETTVEKQIVSAVVINEELTAYQPKYIYQKQEIDNLDELELVFPEAFGVYKNINKGSCEKQKLLLLCDSYLLNYIDYFGDNFSEIICVHAYDVPKLQTLINIYEPDVLIFENVERAMAEFYPKEVIKNYNEAMKEE